MVKCHFWIILLVLVAVIAAGSASLPAAAQPATDGPLNPDLLALADEYADYQNDPALAGLPFVASNDLLRISNDRVAVDVAGADPQALATALRGLGMNEISQAGFVVSGMLPIARMNDLQNLPGLHFARPSYALSMAGLTISQGVLALQAELGRSRYGVDGSGVTVGTLSDSFDCDLQAYTRAAADVASGDLPPDIVILKDLNDPNTCIDEGRAMMQLVHDVAPGARQMFYTAFITEADFAAGVRLLAASGADVIVDDIIYLAEPMFQDGFVAQAVDDVVAQGVSYFSAAGNNGQLGYESSYRAAAPQNVLIDGTNRAYRPHDFDPGPGQDVYQQLLVPAGASIIIVLQWDENFFTLNGAPGSRNDLDIMLFSNPPGAQPIAGGYFGGGISDNRDLDPVEVLRFTNSTLSDRIVNVFIGKRDDGSIDPGTLKYVIFRGSGAVINEYSDSSNNSSLYGHANAAGAMAVGAADYRETPAFGINPPLLEPFSSPGPTAIYLNPDGSRKTAPDIRPKPDFVAPDGTNTTFFPGPPGFATDTDGDGFPNFFGTSAAAPHAAAVAALMLELSPQLSPGELAAILGETAIDMETPGFDRRSGFGLIQADRALAQLGDADLELVADGPGGYAILEEPLTYALTLRNLGGTSARSTVLTETIPAEFDLLDIAGSDGGVCANGVANSAVCDLGTLAEGATVTSTFTLSPTVAGNFAFSALASSLTPESNRDDNQIERSVTIVPRAATVDLQLQWDASAASVMMNEPLTYTLSVRNSGPAVADTVLVTQTLGPGTGFISAEGDGWTCLETGGRVQCSRPELATTLTSTITLRVVAPPAGTLLVHEAEVSSASPEVNLSNNLAAVATIVQPRIYLPLIRAAAP